MVLTKLYLKQWVIAGAIVTFLVGILAFTGGDMIEYYCSPTSLFLGVNFSETSFSAYCGFLVIVSHILGILLGLLILTVIIDGIAIFSKKIRKKFNPEYKITQEIENIKKDIPKFRTLRNHAKIIIDDSNAETVINYVHQYFKNTPRSYGEIQDNTLYRISTENDSYTPKDIGKYGLMVNGIKTTSPHKESLWEGATIMPMSDMESVLILDLFFISAIQGGKDKTEVFFDTQYDEIFKPLSNDVLKKLKGVFNVKEVIGLPDDSFGVIFSLAERIVCSHCNYGYTLNADENQLVITQTTTCPKCGNVDDFRKIF